MILEHFSGRIVQSVNNVIELFLGNVSEICPFGKVSPKQSIGVFVGPPLPGTVRVGKIRPNTQLLLQLRMEIVLTLGRAVPGSPDLTMPRAGGAGD